MTQAEYVAFLARQKTADQTFSIPASTSAPKHEAKLHDQILAECARRGWIAFHGSMAHRTFRTPGEPDMVVVADNSRFFLVECKSTKGKLSPDQLAIAAWANKLGHTVHVVRSMEEFHAICS